MGEIKSCPVCQEKVNQCLSCASYVIDGQRIYYKQLENFGAKKDHEIRFIERLKKQSVIAFFHNDKLHIPSRQGRTVPLAILLQWEAWTEQQERIEQFETVVDHVLYQMKSQGSRLWEVVSADVISFLEDVKKDMCDD